MIAGIFAVVAVAALLFGIVATWSSLRIALGAQLADEVSHDLADFATVDDSTQREALLRTLADLRFDFDAEKISKADYEKIEGETRRELRALMRSDQAQEAATEEARALIQAAIKTLPPADKSAYRSASKTTSRRGTSAERVCASCLLVNDDDARFCKSCGANLAASSAEKVTVSSEDGESE